MNLATGKSRGSPRGAARYSEMNLRPLFRIALLLAALAWLAGCSGLRIAYDNADSIVRWMADDYFELEGPQEDDFRARLARFHAWHRSRELPRYGALLTRAGEKLADGLTEQELRWALDAVTQRYRHTMAHAAPDLAAVLSTLSEAQFAHLQRKFAESNAKYFEKYVEGGEAKQRKQRGKRTLALMRDWFGDLSDEQEGQLNAWNDKMPLLYALRLQNRQRRQDEFVALLRQYRDAARLEPELRHWLIDWDTGIHAEYRRLSDIHEEYYIGMLLELDRSITPKQRAHAASRLNEYAELFRALAARAEGSGS